MKADDDFSYEEIYECADESVLLPDSHFLREVRTENNAGSGPERPPRRV